MLFLEQRYLIDLMNLGHRLVWALSQGPAYPDDTKTRVRKDAKAKKILIPYLKKKNLISKKYKFIQTNVSGSLFIFSMFHTSKLLINATCISLKWNGKVYILVFHHINQSSELITVKHCVKLAGPLHTINKLFSNPPIYLYIT